MPINNMTLVKIASIGGIITCTTGMLMQWKVKDRIYNADYYVEALRVLREHPGAVSLLGEPIKDRQFDLKNKNNVCDSVKARFEVPVRGPKRMGVLYFWANRGSEQDSWKLNRIELGLDNEPDRRLLIKNVE